MNKIINNKSFVFDADNIKMPLVILEEKSNVVRSVTKGYVIAEVKEYDGPIESYEIIAPAENLSRVLSSNFGSVDIQDKLGEQNGSTIKYEFYLTSKVMKDYKFRIMFIEYGIGGYPVKLVLEQGISDEFQNKDDSEYIVELNSREEFEDAIDRILNTQRVLDIMQSLINIGISNDKRSIF